MDEEESSKPQVKQEQDQEQHQDENNKEEEEVTNKIDKLKELNQINSDLDNATNGHHENNSNNHDNNDLNKEEQNNENQNYIEFAKSSNNIINEDESSSLNGESDVAGTSEFTYTSLGGVKPDEFDEQSQTQQNSESEQSDNKNDQKLIINEVIINDQQQQQQQQQNQQSSQQSSNLKPTDSIRINQQQQDTKSVSDSVITSIEHQDVDSVSTSSSIKNLSFDSIIEKVKLNQLANKDVCNYILNLLVDGEFDLEKNFVIKNINSILNMIQVIKCANTSLKAELWSLFTAILRKSQLNLQACVEIGLIETALHELEDADQMCAGRIIF